MKNVFSQQDPLLDTLNGKFEDKTIDNLREEYYQLANSSNYEDRKRAEGFLMAMELMV